MTIERADFIEAGAGETVILVHSSVAGARQWRSLMETLADGFHVVAINLFGYGKTPAWPNDAPQTLEAQARLIEPFLPADGGSISLVGHSFGGSVAMKACALFQDRVRRLVLIEPNPFSLLEKYGRTEAFREAVELQNAIKTNGAAGTWDIAAETFATYWTGAGSWEAMPDDRKTKFIEALKPNFHEWDAVMNDRTSLRDWDSALPKDTTVLSAADTVRSIDEIVSLMKEQIPHWTFQEIGHGGHMAIMTKPDVLNPVVKNALS